MSELVDKEKKIKSRIQHKHDTKENWDKATGFAPYEGEIIVYDDLNKIKIGKRENGNLVPVNELPFFADTHNKDFAKIKINDAVIEAEAERDTLMIVAGSNITLDADPTNNTVTIESTNPDLSKGTSITETKNLNFGDSLTAVSGTSVSSHTITDTVTTYTLPTETVLTVTQDAEPSIASTLNHNSTFTVVTEVAKGTTSHELSIAKTTFTLPTDLDTDKKAASGDTSNKIYLIGAENQSVDGQTTYSHDTVFIDTDGHLYDSGSRVTTEATTYTQNQINTLVSELNDQDIAILSAAQEYTDIKTLGILDSSAVQTQVKNFLANHLTLGVGDDNKVYIFLAGEQLGTGVDVSILL